jgi:hypothetical protein
METFNATYIGLGNVISRPRSDKTLRTFEQNLKDHCRTSELRMK